MPLEILFEHQANITYPNESRLEDALEPSRLVYDIEPIHVEKSKAKRSYIPGLPKIEDVDEFYEVDKEGLFLVAHQKLRLRNGEIINQELLGYHILQHIPQNRVRGIERYSREGLEYLNSVKSFLLGDTYIENPTLLLAFMAARFKEHPESPNGYLLILVYDQIKNENHIVPYNDSLIDAVKVGFEEFRMRIHSERKKPK